MGGNQRVKKSVMLCWKSMTSISFDKKSTTPSSKPVRGRRCVTQWGLGKNRASKTKSASTGTPCLNAKDWNIMVVEPGFSATRSLTSSRSWWSVISEVSIFSAAIIAMPSSSRLSTSNASFKLICALLNGCFRRVSLNLLIKIGLDASK